MFEEISPLPTLNLIFLLDTSGSMTGERINHLNAAMDEVVRIAEAATKEQEIKNHRILHINGGHINQM